VLPPPLLLLLPLLPLLLLLLLLLLLQAAFGCQHRGRHAWATRRVVLSRGWLTSSTTHRRCTRDANC